MSETPTFNSKLQAELPQPTNLTQESKEKKEHDPYKTSKAFQMLQQGVRKVAIFDIDSTLTGTPKQQTEIRRQLEEQGTIVMFVSSRVYEMMISKKQREQSQIENLRPVPKLKNEMKEYVIDNVRENVKIFQEAQPDELDSFAGIVDAEFTIDGTGSNILLEQAQGGYMRDQEFADDLRTESKAWREFTLKTVEQVQMSIIQDKLQNVETMSQLDPGTLAGIDIEGNFEANRADVAPPDHRIQLSFKNLESKLEFTRRLEDLKLQETREKEPQVLAQIQQQIEAGTSVGEYLNSKNILEKTYLVGDTEYTAAGLPIRKVTQMKVTRPEGVLNTRVTDDSKPEEGRFQIYITPNVGYKARAADHAFSRMLATYNETQPPDNQIKKSDMEVLISGDSFPDQAMMLYGALGANVTAEFAGGSRLVANGDGTYKLMEHFAGENNQAIINRMTAVGNGEYEFTVPLVGKRRVIIADERYPGKKGPESILALLAEEAEKKSAT